MVGKRTTAERQADFLEHFAFGSVCGNISAACRKARICRRIIYDWLRDDEDFAEAFKEAETVSIDHLEEVAQTRATVGWDARKVVVKTQRVAKGDEVFRDEDGAIVQMRPGEMYEIERTETVERKVDNMILMRLLEARRPEKFSRRHNLEAGDKLAGGLQTLADIMATAAELEDDEAEQEPDSEREGPCAPDEAES